MPAKGGTRITVIEMRRGPRFFPNLNFDKASPCFALTVSSFGEGGFFVSVPTVSEFLF